MNHSNYCYLFIAFSLLPSITASNQSASKEMNIFLDMILAYTRKPKEFNQKKFNSLKKNLPQVLKKLGFTLLMIATTSKQLSYVKAFLPFSNLNTASKDGTSALHVAALGGNLAITTLLLKQDHIQIDIKDTVGMTPLHLASQNGHTQIVDILIRKGSQVNALTHNKDTPLMLALKSKQQKTAKFLLITYPMLISINTTNKQGVTALHLATRDSISHHEIIQIMLKMPNLNPNINDLKYGYPPLIKMILYRKTALAIMLIQHPKISINQPSKNTGESPLIYSIKTNNPAILKEILDHPNTNINQQNSNGNTALMYTVLNHKVELMELLLREKIDLFIKNKKKQTVFDIAKKLKKEKISQLLTEACYISFFEAIYEKNQKQEAKIAEHLNLKTKINLQNVYNGGTLLLLACYLEATYVVKTLLEKYGANPSISDLTYLNTPLMIASTKGYRPIVKIVLKFLQKGKINQVDYHGNTALMMACDAGHRKLVKTLLKCTDIDIYLPNKKQITAITIVAKRGYVKILDMLLEKSNVNHLNKDRQGYTALIAGSMHGHTAVIKRLLNCHKIDWHAKKGKKYYLYAFLTAQKQKHYKIIELFKSDIAAELLPQHITINSKISRRERKLEHTAHNQNKKIVGVLIHNANENSISSFQKNLPLQIQTIYLQKSQLFT